MKKLIEAGLMYGNLFHVNSPILVERYNRALEHLTGKWTSMSDFHIDLSGYAPEIGAEFDDHLYLNHGGVNRQFILLSPDQRRCPLLNAKFSTSRDILRRFISENEAQLFALTASDAVAGELVNSVFEVTSADRLFDLRRIEVEADTTEGTVQHANELAALVDRFKSEEDAWYDDVLIAEMITLAGKSGDVLRNPIRLKSRSFEQRDFWTAHFGGLYIFQEVHSPAVLSVGSESSLGPLPIAESMSLSDRNRVAQFLDSNALIEPIVAAQGIDSVAVLRQKLDFIVIDAAADANVDLTGLTRSDLRRLTRRHADQLPTEYHGLSALLNWAETGGPWPHITSEHPAYFYTLRASPGPDADLVNMLLAELCPLDIRQMFICHKELFYAHYAKWTAAKQAYVVEFLVNEYQMDKAGARAALFGNEPDMRDAPTPPAEEDLIHRVGPWGALRRV